MINPFRRKEKQMNFDAFAMLANALGGGGNVGAIMPIDDANDLHAGAEYIPYEVTDARRTGEKVIYFPIEKHWQMPDGTIVK